MAAATGVIFSSVLSLSSISPLMFEERVECEGDAALLFPIPAITAKLPPFSFAFFSASRTCLTSRTVSKSVFGVMFSTIAAAAVVVVVVVVGVTGSFVDGWC